MCHLCVNWPEKVKCNARGNKGILSYCKCIFEHIGTNWSISSLEISKMFKNAFVAKYAGHWFNNSSRKKRKGSHDLRAFEHLI